MGVRQGLVAAARWLAPSVREVLVSVVSGLATTAISLQLFGVELRRAGPSAGTPTATETPIFEAEIPTTGTPAMATPGAPTVIPTPGAPTAIPTPGVPTPTPAAPPGFDVPPGTVAALAVSLTVVFLVLVVSVNRFRSRPV